MIKVYGMSDAEKELLQYLKGIFMEIEINSLEEYNEFVKSPNRFKQIIIDPINQDIQQTNKLICELKEEQNDIYNELKTINYQISKKLNTLKKVYGPLKEEILGEFNSLKNKKEWKEGRLAEIKSKLFKSQQELNNLLQKRKVTSDNLDKDIYKLSQLRSDSKLNNYLTGAWGEKHVIEFLKESFEAEKNFHLINSFNIDLLGKAISFQDRTLAENKIDHILLCPKGLYVLETKSWNSVNQSGVDKVLEQLTKIKLVFSKVFDEDINKNTKLLVICTKKHIEIPKDCGFKSIKIENLKDFVSKKKNVLTKDEVHLILDKLLPHLDRGHIGTAGKTIIKVKTGFIKGKNLIKKAFGPKKR